MHSFLVAFAYLAMIFAPCAVAQWGDVLVMPWNLRFAAARRRNRVMDPLIAAVMREREAAEMATLFDDAFAVPRPLHAYSGKARPPRTLIAALLEATGSHDSALEAARARVAARLADLVLAHQLANTPLVANNAAEVMADPVPMPASAAPRGDSQFDTPSAAELDALYARQYVDGLPVESPPLLEPEAAPMQLVPAALLERLAADRSPDPARLFLAEPPPVSIAA